MADHADISAHPRMHVALHRNHDFLPAKLFFFGSPLGGCDSFHSLLSFGSGWMLWLVGSSLMISNSWLSSRHHVRLVHASLLLELDRAARGRPLLVRKARLHIDKHVLQRAIVIDKHFLRFLRRGMGAGASGVASMLRFFITGLSPENDTFPVTVPALGLICRRGTPAAVLVASSFGFYTRRLI
jgi:hypothetical protein